MAVKAPKHCPLGDEFLREAQIAAQMDDHPNLVRVTDFGDEGGVPVLVMDYFDGPNVASEIKDYGPLDDVLALRITRDILDGLSALHKHGITHRDVKPGNFLIQKHDSRVKLSDFGSASQRGMLGLTPAYTAPELYQGNPATPASDIFAIGVSLFEMLSGCLPWDGTLEEIASGILHEPPPSLEAASGKPVDPRLEGFFLRCVAKTPAERWPGAAEALHEVDQLLQARRTGKIRVAVIAFDGQLAKVLGAALQATDELVTLGTACTPTPLRPLRGQLDAIVLDPESAQPREIEGFVGETRDIHCAVVFFILVRVSTWPEIRKRFSGDWPERFGHYFVLPLDDSLADLPAQIRTMSVAILFEQMHGKSKAKG